MANRFLTPDEAAEGLLRDLRELGEKISMRAGVSEEDGQFWVAYEFQTRVGRFPHNPQSDDGQRFERISEEIRKAGGRI
jgi:hypothetical protein